MQISKADFEDVMDIEDPLSGGYSPGFSWSNSTNCDMDISQSSYEPAGLSARESRTSMNLNPREESKCFPLNSGPSNSKAEVPQPSCKKNSLKFCRRISKALIDLATNTTNNVSNALQEVTLFIHAIVERQIDLFDGTILDSKTLERLHIEFVKKVWEKNREILSEKKNNRLSLVNFEEWNTLFSFKGFCNRLHATSNNLSQLSKTAEFPSEAVTHAFLEFYSKILYTLNVLMLNIVTFVMTFIDKDLIRIIPDLDNFALMTVEPWVYKHYNHTKAKFALECCSVCKVCRSSLLPSNFKERLTNARSRYRDIKDAFEKYLRDLSTNSEASLDSSIFPFLAYDMWNY